MAFEEATGTFTPDLLAGGKTDGKAPAHSANRPIGDVAIVVEFHGFDHPSADHKVHVELVATQNKNTVLDSIVVKEDFLTTQYALFTLQGLRCEKLELSARVVGKGAQKAIARTVDFSCGE